VDGEAAGGEREDQDETVHRGNEITDEGDLWNP